MRKRSKHNLSHYRMHTADMGELFPIGCVPVLPGDTFQHQTSALVRVSPLNTPVMHPVQVRIHHFFVPNRIVWDKEEDGGWETFITGGPQGDNTSTVPQQTFTVEKKSVAAYLGLPPTTSDRSFNILPTRAFNKTYNEFYRDQDIVNDRSLGAQALPRIAWEKDYFTTARPWAQKGPEITLPVGDGYVGVDADTLGDALSIFQNGDVTDGARIDTSGPIADLGSNAAPYPNEGSLRVELNQININDFRAAFSLQRYQEARARYGSRFTEYLRYLGVTPSDARLQRPEYLGGSTARLNFSEVLQTTPGQPGENGVGDLYGHGIAGVRTNGYRKFFEEHGYVITLMSVRPKAVYVNGAHREHIKLTKEDFWQRELQNLGQQEVDQRELYFDTDAGTTFGFQDRYDEYRMHPSTVHQDFRDLLNAWHLGRELDEDVALNGDFLFCDPSKRIFQVEENDSLWVMVNHKLIARRLVQKRAYPKIL